MKTKRRMKSSTKHLGHLASPAVLRAGHNNSGGVIDWFKKTFGSGKPKIVSTDRQIKRQQLNEAIWGSSSAVAKPKPKPKKKK